MTGAIDAIRCEISNYRELAAFLALIYINMGFPMYVTLTNIPTANLSPVKGSGTSFVTMTVTRHADINNFFVNNVFKNPRTWS